VWPAKGKITSGPLERNYEIMIFGKEYEKDQLGNNKINAFTSDKRKVHFMVEGLSLEEAHTLDLW
jgi:hypothetical protein